MTVRILRPAEAEIDSAVAFYESRRTGLGHDFALEVQSGLKRIEAFPNAWRKLGRRVRWHRLNRFPYGIRSVTGRDPGRCRHAYEAKARILARTIGTLSRQAGVCRPLADNSYQRPEFLIDIHPVSWQAFVPAIQGSAC